MRRHLLLALALLAVIVGIVVAVTSAGGGGHKRSSAGAGRAQAPVSEITIAARYLGMTRRELRRRLRGETLAEVANATTGRSAAGLEKALLASHETQLRAQKLSGAEERARALKAREQVTAAVTHRRRSPGGITLAAGYLGLSQAVLQSKLAHGHSLASLAETKEGTSRSGLIALIVNSRRKRVERALASGAITPKQERATIALLSRRAAREVDRTRP